MRITDITDTKKGRKAIFVDGEFICSLHPEVFALERLAIGEDVDAQALSEMVYGTELKITKERALRLLSGQGYTKKQLLDRLCRYADEDVALEAVDRMEELGLINDLDYALRCSRDLVRLKGYSTRRVALELRYRGIGEEEIAQAVAQFEDDDPREAIAKVVSRKFPRLWEDEKVERRAFGALSRLGYAFEDIRYVFAHPDEFEL